MSNVNRYIKIGGELTIIGLLHKIGDIREHTVTRTPVGTFPIEEMPPDKHVYKQYFMCELDGQSLTISFEDLAINMCERRISYIKESLSVIRDLIINFATTTEQMNIFDLTHLIEVTQEPFNSGSGVFSVKHNEY